MTYNGHKDVFMHNATIVRERGKGGFPIYKLKTASHGVLKTEYQSRERAYMKAKELGFKRVFGRKGEV